MLRALIEIVPYGDEVAKYPIYKLEISNEGLVRDEGFGHQICRYRVKVYGYVNETMRRMNKTEEEWEFFHVDWIEEHDRRDGAIALVAKAAKLVEEKT